MIKELTSYSQRLSSKLEADDISMSFNNDRLADALPNNNDYTILTIDDGVNVEVVRAYKDAGEVLIERGRGDTTAQTFPAGACVKFKINGEFIRHFVCAMPAECKPNPLPNECGGCDGCCD